MPKCYAILPAAGRSRRMGQAKLILPWGKNTVMDQVLSVWTSCQLDEIVVVLRADDHDLAAICRQWPVTLVQPETDPPDMKASICAGHDYLQQQHSPNPYDLCVIAPADLPGLRAEVLRKLRQQSATEPILAATYGKHRSHPTRFQWTVLNDLPRIPEARGVDWLMEQYPVRLVPFPAERYCPDLDTPQQYEAARPLDD